MLRASRRPSHQSCLLAALFLLIAGLPPAAFAAARQDPAPPAAEIAAPPILETAWSFTGRGQIAEGQFTAAGPLIAVSGLEAAMLTAGGASASAQDVAAAGTPTGTATGATGAGSRFTFVAEIPITGTTNRGTLVTVQGSGTVTIYLRDPATDPPLDPADFESYRTGAVVAEYAATFQSTAQRETPEVGIISGSMTLDQTGALNFPLDEQMFRFGHAAAQLNVTFTGGLAPNTTGIPTTEASIFGTAKVARRNLEPTATGDAVLTPELSECEQLVAWIGDTRVRLQAAGELRANLPDPTSADTSADDISGAAATASRLLNEQLALATPETADAANRLALSSLSTDVRGLELLAAAVEAGDDAAIAQAQAIQSDAEGLATRALEALDAITPPTCEPES